jgi:hypothetical protein
MLEMLDKQPWWPIAKTDKRVSADEVHANVERYSMMFRDLMLSFVRLHVLHHANEGEIF